MNPHPQPKEVPMSRLEAIVLRLVSRFCVDPASGDIAADGVFRWSGEVPPSPTARKPGVPAGR